MIEEMELRAGELRFPARASGKGPLVLLLHGFPDHARTFDPQVEALAAAGYRAIAPTLRGYAPQAQPADGDYHAIRMVEDVLAWADQLGESRFHLVGHDWGATIAFGVAGIAPERVASLSVLAVPHPVRFAEAYAADPEQQRRSAYILDFLQPGAESRVAADDFAYLEQLWRSWSPTWDIPPAALADMRETFSAPGVTEAALSYYRQAFDAASEAGARTQAILAGPFAVPTLGLCGTDDGCIGADLFTSAMRDDDFPLGLKVEQLPGAGHFLHREQPAVVNDLLLDWLGRHPARRAP